MLLTPNWVGKHLFNREEIDVAFPMMPAHPLRFSADKVFFTPSDDRALINLEVVDGEAWQKAEEIALRLLDNLPHTPISAFGINFLFSEDDPSPELLRIFEFTDMDRLTRFGCRSESFRIQRSFSLDDDLKLNLKVEFTESAKLRFDLNFHFAVSGAQEAKQLLRGKTAICKLRTYKLMKEVYDLELEGGQE